MNYYVIVVDDTGNTVSENSETNNTKATSGTRYGVDRYGVRAARGGQSMGDPHDLPKKKDCLNDPVCK